jgi:GNAT superfamily N-acetyltransferase
MQMQISFRPVAARDFEYCRCVYFAGMREILEKLHLDREAQESALKELWDQDQVRMIVLDGVDVGWMQTTMEDGDFFVGQLFLDKPHQGRGIGTQVMERLIAEAARAKQAVRLNVVKINPAVRLYTRLGFHVVREDDRKFYMRREY